MIRHSLLFLVLSFSLAALAQDDRAELDRLRRENAALKTELAKLKAELAKVTAELDKAKAPAAATPKPTVYTPDMILKLIPREDLPDGAGRWDPAKRERVKKIVNAHLEGEWVQIAIGAVEMPLGDGDKPWKLFGRQPAGPLGVSIFLDCGFAEKPAGLGKRPGTVTIIGRVHSAGLYPDDMNQVMVALTDCRLAK